MQVERIQSNNNIITPQRIKRYNSNNSVSFKSRSHMLQASKNRPQELFKKIVKSTQESLVHTEINMILSGAIGTFAGAVTAALTGLSPLLMVAGLGAGLVVGAIPVILFISNPENDVPGVNMATPMDFFRELKEWRDEAREQRARERRRAAELPPLAEREDPRPPEPWEVRVARWNREREEAKRQKEINKVNRALERKTGY